MTVSTRYRVEGGRSCIDPNVRQSRQLFDTRDPAPFRERDLDADVVEYYWLPPRRFLGGTGWRSW